MHLSQTHKIVNAAPPADINGAGLDGAWVNLRNHGHLTAVILLGVVGSATTITVEEAGDVSGADAQARPFQYRQEATSGGDTLEALSSASSSGLVSTTNNNTFYAVELKAAELSPGFDCVRVRLSDPGAATLAGVAYILGDARYGQEVLPSALTD